MDPSTANLSGFKDNDLVAFLQSLVKGDCLINASCGFSPRMIEMMTWNLHNTPQPNVEEDKEAYEAIMRPIDYFRSRAIKTTLVDGIVDGRLYDRDTEEGSFVRIANRIREDRSIVCIY